MNKAALALSVAALFLSLVWWSFERNNFEPLIVFLLGLAGLITTFVPRPFKTRRERDLTLSIPGLRQVKDVAVFVGADINNWQAHDDFRYEPGPDPGSYGIRLKLQKKDKFKHFVVSLDDEETRHKVVKILEHAGHIVTGEGDKSRVAGMWRTWFLLNEKYHFSEQGDGVLRVNLWE